ncbi:hypothetical protein EPUL_002845 [Erysiphe pulchra]|uniref:Uncharacterized protein n=1 Tax=Erysiphe pulchra TaxID=225359 RepID=A0A2S4PT51_9PEZI|nr:hypothetical protein EPUL_002845 [Erysiphe pulchra]
MSASNASSQFTQTQTKPLKLQKREHRPKETEASDTMPQHWERRDRRSYSTSKLWGSLAKIHLTKNALNELNYQNRQLKTWRVQPNFNLDIVSEQFESIRQLAREGGPDLTYLRGSLTNTQWSPVSQASLVDEQSSQRRKIRRRSNDKNFEDILQDFGIYGFTYVGPESKSSIVPLNLEEIIERANEPRPSVTPVTIPSSVFESFRTTVLVAKKESEVVKHPVPILEGGIRVENQEFQNTTFSSLEQFKDTNIEQRALVKGTPDRFYGSPFEQLYEEVREDLNSKVVPTAEKTNLIAANFFLELKGSEGHQTIADLQAQYYGALVERGQIALRSWGHDASVLDGKAHTIACTYVSRVLTFFSIHAAKSSEIDGRIEYFMHMIDAFVLSASASKFRNAIAAYQNLQDYAEEKRNEAIELANTRAREIREAS